MPHNINRVGKPVIKKVQQQEQQQEQQQQQPQQQGRGVGQWYRAAAEQQAREQQQ